MPASNRLNAGIPAWIWLGFPVLFLLFIIAVLLYDYELGKNMIARENHLVELGTAILLIPGIVFGLLSVKLKQLLPDIKLFIWLSLLTAACFYFAGEELSWGQQLFKWETPETIRSINDQNETNLHNISSWLDQKPRILVELWVLIGGIFYVLWRIIRNIEFSSDNWKYWFWPDIYCLPAAILAILVKIPERLRDFFDIDVFEKNVRYSELQEFYIALFLSLYIYSFYKRMKMLAAES